MIKTYKAPSIYSTNVLVNGQRVHISFYALNHGGSFYETCDENIQKALEENRFYGKDFYLASEVEEEPVAEAAPAAAEEPAEKKEVNVASLAEAKEYLAETYGLTRTSLRTKASILAAAEEHNIEFVGI